MPFKDPEKRKAYAREKSKRALAENPDKEKLRRAQGYKKHREKILAKQKQYYAENAEKYGERSKAYREGHKEELSAYGKKYYTDNAEKIKAASLAYHKANRDKILAQNNERRKHNTDGYRKRDKDRGQEKGAWISALKDKPCEDCGFCGAPYQMDFDHVDPKTKLANVATMRHASKEKILEEIAKCRLLCACCHRLRTHTPTEKPRKQTEFIRALKTHPCMDCGCTYSPCAMDFDHREPALKTASLSRMLSCSVDEILAEVAKCDLICANCHRERTHGVLQRKPKKGAT